MQRAAAQRVNGQGGAHYVVATPHFGAPGGQFSGFRVLENTGVDMGEIEVTSFEVGADVGFWWIFNTTTVAGATDLAIARLQQHGWTLPP